MTSEELNLDKRKFENRNKIKRVEHLRLVITCYLDSIVRPFMIRRVPIENIDISGQALSTGVVLPWTVSPFTAILYVYLSGT